MLLVARTTVQSVRSATRAPPSGRSGGVIEAGRSSAYGLALGGRVSAGSRHRRPPRSRCRSRALACPHRLSFDRGRAFGLASDRHLIAGRRLFGEGWIVVRVNGDRGENATVEEPQRLLRHRRHRRELPDRPGKRQLAANTTGEGAAQLVSQLGAKPRSSLRAEGIFRNALARVRHGRLSRRNRLTDRRRFRPHSGPFSRAASGGIRSLLRRPRAAASSLSYSSVMFRCRSGRRVADHVLRHAVVHRVGEFEEPAHQRDVAFESAGFPECRCC